MRATITIVRGIAVAAGLVAGGAAVATDVPATPGNHASETHLPPDSRLGPALDIDALDALRGGDSVENRVDIHGEVTGNTAEHVTSGDNVVRGEAFGNAAGINTLIQNTGSNVLVQNGMTVNVQFAPPP